MANGDTISFQTAVTEQTGGLLPETGRYCIRTVEDFVVFQH